MQHYLASIIAILCALTSAFALSNPPVEKLVFTDSNFHVSVLSNQVPYARQLALTKDNSILFIGTSTDKVYAIQLETMANGDIVQNPNTELLLVASGLDVPNGVAVDDSTGNLYIACNYQVYVVQDAVSSVRYGSVFADPVQIIELQGNDGIGFHNRRFIELNNGLMYVTLGAPCDACLVSPPNGTISSFVYTAVNSSQQNFQTVVTGVRNSAGMDFHPVTGELWFTDNGRDVINSPHPYDELNVLPTGATNTDYGFPFCYEKDWADPQFNPSGNCSPYVPAQYVLGSHVAALGMTFYRGNMFPPKYGQNHIILIAEHGSISHNPATGYRITMVDPTNSSASSYQPFATGFFDETTSSPWGRPVDVLSMNDGSVLVSDDYAGAVYRITYNNASSSSNDIGNFVSVLVIALIAQLLIFVLY